MNRTRTIAAGALGAVLLTGCSPADDEPGAAGPAATTGSTPAATVTARPAPTGILGTPFTDPKQRYTMTIGAQWVPDETGSGAPQWIVGMPADGVKPSVLITVEKVRPGTTATSFLRKKLAHLRSAGRTIVKTATVKGTGGTRTLIGIESKETIRFGDGDRARFHNLSLFALDSGLAVEAGLAAPESTFPAFKAQVLPYLRTLTLTPDTP